MGLYSSLAEYYEEIFPVSNDQVLFISNTLNEHSVKSIIDIGCATGELDRILVKRGFTVAGIDSTPEMIEKALKTAREEELQDKTEFAVFSMEKITELLKPGSINALLCLGNTLPHISSDEVLTSFLQDCFNILTKGGVFIIQIVNFSAFNSAGTEFPVITLGNVRFERSYSCTENSNVSFDTFLSCPAGEFKDTTMLLNLTPTTLFKQLKEVGFSSVQLYENYQKKPCSKMSEIIHALCIK